MLKMLLLNADPNAISSWTVIAMGMGIVFVGLICLIFICKILGAIFSKVKTKEVSTPAQKAVVNEVKSDVIPNKSELVAAVSAAIAESMGTDVSKIRIHSIKKI